MSDIQPNEPLDLDTVEKQLRDQLAKIESLRQQQDQTTRQQQEQEATTRQQFTGHLGDLYRLIGLLLVVFSAADFASGQIEEGGWLSYGLHYLGQYAYLIGITLAAVTIAIRLIWPLVSHNLTGLVTDWQQTTPGIRLAILTALIIGILHFLTSVVPHAS